MGSRGLYLKKWTLDFNLTKDIPSPVSVWVWLPHLPILYWNNDSMRVVGNTLEKYINLAEPKA